ncbi:unnamed protein product [Rangifer tarandus platyrhynchus]|uniref:Uncharacterized protein n=1 Tax=Rangifer tarandus platyrhynchus TaxID=3082113 RepID=A0AC59YZW6_RANTA
MEPLPPRPLDSKPLRSRERRRAGGRSRLVCAPQVSPRHGPVHAEDLEGSAGEQGSAFHLLCALDSKLGGLKGQGGTPHWLCARMLGIWVEAPRISTLLISDLLIPASDANNPLPLARQETKL